jgi:5-carboxymethyl-2-hydroxymuconate isomerase
MPHIHLETTADLHENADVPEILEGLIGALVTVESINPATVKAYHTLLKNWHVGEGHAPGFAHVTLEILSGRSSELKAKMADVVFAELQTRFAYSREQEDGKITLEIREMDAATYRS